jgi:hypothetical protein
VSAKSIAMRMIGGYDNGTATIYLAWASVAECTLRRIAVRMIGRVYDPCHS